MLIITFYLLQLFFEVAAISAISPLSLDFHVEQRENGLKDNLDGIANRGFDVHSRYIPSTFVVDLLIGSNLQNVSAFVDPSSSDLSVVGEGSVLAISLWRRYDFAGTFNYSKSITFKRNDSAPSYYENHSIESNGTGFWGQDDIIIGNTTIKEMDFAVKNSSSMPFGVLGLGFADSVSTNTNSSTPYIYESLLTRLKNQGTISKAAYSMYFTPRGLDGTLLFGAIDHEKYTGLLSTLPMIKSSLVGSNIDHVRKIQILLDGIDFNVKENTVSVTNNTYFAAIFPTSPSSYLPKTLLNNLAKSLSAYSFSEIRQAWLVPCTNDKTVTVLLNFGATTIRVPVKNFIKSNSFSCTLSILSYPDQEDYVVLGQDILQEAYVVYDNEEREVSIAQVRNTKKKNIEEINSAVPHATVGTNTPTTIDPIASEAPNSEVIGFETVAATKFLSTRSLSSETLPSLLMTIIGFFTVVII